MSGPGKEAAHHARSALILVTCVLASSLAFVDGSAVNVGLPAIGRGLGCSSGACCYSGWPRPPVASRRICGC
jgi:hypothetical protein